MSATANKQLLQDIFAALAQSDSRPFVDAMADDFRWTMVGSNKWARTYAGKQAVIGELFAALRAQDGPHHHHRASLHRGRRPCGGRGARRKHHQGRPCPIATRYCFVFRVADGKLAELTEYMDSELVTAVLGDP